MKCVSSSEPGLSSPGVLVVDLRASKARQHHRHLQGEYLPLDTAGTKRTVFQKWDVASNRRYYIFHQEGGEFLTQKHREYQRRLAVFSGKL